MIAPDASVTVPSRVARSVWASARPPVESSATSANSGSRANEQQRLNLIKNSLRGRRTSERATGQIVRWCKKPCIFGVDTMRNRQEWEMNGNSRILELSLNILSDWTQNCRVGQESTIKR